MCGTTCTPPTYQCCDDVENCPPTWFCCDDGRCEGFEDSCAPPTTPGAAPTISEFITVSPTTEINATGFNPLFLIIPGVIIGVALIAAFFKWCRPSKYKWMIFISYNQGDSSGCVDLLKNDMARVFGLRTSQIFVDKDFLRKIEDAVPSIQASAVPCILISPNYCKSAWCLAEALTCMRDGKSFTVAKLDTVKLDKDAIGKDIDNINKTFQDMHGVVDKMGHVSEGEIEMLKGRLIGGAPFSYHATDGEMVRNADVQVMFEGVRGDYFNVAIQKSQVASYTYEQKL